MRWLDYLRAGLGLICLIFGLGLGVFIILAVGSLASSGGIVGFVVVLMLGWPVIGTVGAIAVKSIAVGAVMIGLST